MKKILLTLSAVAFFGFPLFSQNYKIEDALISLGDGNFELAKRDIDEAAKNSSTANSSKMWNTRGAVYNAIASDSNYSHLNPDASYVSVESYINSIMVEKNERKKPYTQNSLQNLVVACRPLYIKAFYYYEVGDYTKSLSYWGLMLKAYETDTTNGIEKGLGVAKNDIVMNSANIALKAGDKANAKKYLQQMMDDPKYLSPNAYLQMSFMYLEEGDTTAALEVIAKGRKKIPEDKNLFNQELAIYTQLGKIDVLVKKLDEVIQSEPNNITYLFYRGAIVNDNAVKIMEKAPEFTDSATSARTKMKKAAKAADKSKYKAEMEKFEHMRDSLYEKANKLFDAAEKDYNNALLIDPYYFDALYNIGAMYFNKNKELIDRYNYLDITAPGATEKSKDLESKMKEGYQKALEPLLKAYEIHPEDEAVLLSLQQTYSQLGDKENSEKFRELRTSGGN